MTKVPELGQEILQKKYYLDGETEPEDVFLRVAKAVSIPDVLDEILVRTENTEYDILTVDGHTEFLEKIFSDFQHEFWNALNRRCQFCYIKEKSNTIGRSFPVGSNLRLKEGIIKDIVQEIWEKHTNKYYEAMCNLDFVPASPILMNAGTGERGMLSSCFFLRVEDSMQGIFDSVKNVAWISKLGGGVGLDFSDLRPEGSPVKGTKGESSGPISFMKVFNMTGETVVQGGRRKAALLAGLSIEHPDIVKFVTCKDTEGDFQNFNISVFVTDKFLENLKKCPDCEYQAKFGGEVYLIRKKDNKAIIEPVQRSPDEKNVYWSVGEIWSLITKQAWKNGEPGVIFEDKLNQNNYFSQTLGKYGVNPCLAPDTLLLDGDKLRKISEGGETWDSWKVGEKEVVEVLFDNYLKIICTPDHNVQLISGEFLPISECIDKKVKLGFEDRDTIEKAFFNSLYETLEKEDITPFSRIQRGMGDQREYCKIKEILPKGKQEVWDFRMKSPPHYNFCNGVIAKNCGEISLLNHGVCTLASINLANHVSEEDIDFEKLDYTTKLVTSFLDNITDINEYPLEEIEKMALMERRLGIGTMGLHDAMLKRGIIYGNNKICIDFIDDIYGTIKNESRIESERLGRERGIPPELEKLGLKRRNIALTTCAPTGTTSIIAGVSSGVEPNFQWEYVREDSYGQHKIQHWILDKIKDIDVPEYVKTALEISPEDHVAVQAAVQKHVDNNISKTTNLHEKATPEDVDKIYRKAHELGCKSITVYRTGSRKKEVLQKKKEKEVEVIKEEQIIEKALERGRPRVLFGATFQIATPEGKAYITVNEDRKGTRECLVTVSKSGSSLGAFAASLGRLISNNLQYSAPIESIIQHLVDQKSDPVWEYGRSVKSVPDAIAKVLKEYQQNYEGFSEYMPEDMLDQEEAPEEGGLSGDLCPECGNVMVMEGACCSCKNCGFSRCG